MRTGGGEWIWRPLVNPPAVHASARSPIDNPHGFGLLQRDRNFDHYQDDGVWYDRRPSVWVEPLSGFGQGQLSIFSRFRSRTRASTTSSRSGIPATPVANGNEYLFAYRLHWGSKMPRRRRSRHAAATWTRHRRPGRRHAQAFLMALRRRLRRRRARFACARCEGRAGHHAFARHRPSSSRRDRSIRSTAGARCSTCGRPMRARSRSICGCSCARASGRSRRRGFISGLRGLRRLEEPRR